MRSRVCLACVFSLLAMASCGDDAESPGGSGGAMMGAQGGGAGVASGGKSSGGVNAGGSVAAPAFGKIAEFALPYLGVPSK